MLLATTRRRARGQPLRVLSAVTEHELFGPSTSSTSSPNNMVVRMRSVIFVSPVPVATFTKALTLPGSILTQVTSLLYSSSESQVERPLEWHGAFLAPKTTTARATINRARHQFTENVSTGISNCGRRLPLNMSGCGDNDICFRSGAFTDAEGESELVRESSRLASGRTRKGWTRGTSSNTRGGGLPKPGLQDEPLLTPSFFAAQRFDPAGLPLALRLRTLSWTAPQFPGGLMTIDNPRLPGFRHNPHSSSIAL